MHSYGDAPWDNQWCQNIVVEGCLFITDPIETAIKNNQTYPINGSVMKDAFGYHANWMQPDTDEIVNNQGPAIIPESDQTQLLLGNNKHRYIKATNNIIIGSVWGSTPNNTATHNTTAFKIRHMQDSVFSDNISRVVQHFCEIEHASNIIIANNIVTGRGDTSTTQDGNQFSNAFVIERKTHNAGPWLGEGCTFFTTSRHINASNNMCNNVIFNNQMLISAKNSY